MNYKLNDLLDIPKLRKLLDALEEIQKIPSAILDIDGNILTASAWQDICTQFHRAHPETEKKCQQSDKYIEAKLHQREFPVVYRCPMGLVDAAMPIIIEEHHLGNVFVGQLFSEPQEKKHFISQARKYGFDVDNYISAFQKVPIISEEKLRRDLEFIHDLTQMLAEQGLQRKRLQETQKSLRDAEWKFKALFENGPIGVAYHRMIYDDVGNAIDYYFLDANDAYQDLTGVDPREKTVKEAFPGIENDPFDWIGTFGRVAKAGETIRFEQYLQPNDRWYDCVAYQYQPDHFVAAFQEITERKKAEAEIYKLSATLNAAMDCSPAGIAIADAPGGKLSYVNNAGMHILGEKQEFVFKNIDIDQYVTYWKLFDLDGKPLKTEEVPLARALLYGENCKREFIVRRSDMEDRIVLANAAPILNHSGDIVSAVVVFMDITQLKRNEEERIKIEKQMVQTQKLESLGVLAGGIAHDFNNLLAAIMGHAELTRRRLPPESDAIENLKQIEKSTERAADLAKQMLAYSGKGKFVVEPIDLNRLITEMLHMLKVSISKKAVLRFDGLPTLPLIEADATQIRQVIMNIVINASEAIGEKSGVISIATGCMDCDQSYLEGVWLDKNLSEGLYVYLEISDTGCGMNNETLAKLFDPFYSTKFAGRGLGMSAVMGIVRGHKGAIKVYSEPGKGTSFKILLPASDKPKELFNGDTEDEGWSGTGKVLLVDDEESVRGIGIEMLKELGFNPLTANHGREALEVFKGNPDIKLVILDLTMPKMDGQQCFQELRKLDPKVRVIMSSGYNEFEVSQKFIGRGISGFVQKPYKFSTLREAIKKAMTQLK